MLNMHKLQKLNMRLIKFLRISIFILLIPITRKILIALIMKNKKQNSKEKTIEAEIIEEKKDEL